MSVKFENGKYIKQKIKDKFNDIEVYNPEFFPEVFEGLKKIIIDNSNTVELEDGINDVRVNNTTKILKYMLGKLTNIENEEYWNSISDFDLENMFNLADGDFEKVINSLLDIMIKVGRNIRNDENRKLDILNDSLKEMIKTIKSKAEINNTLSEIGFDMDKLIRLQNGDEGLIKELQENIVKQISKPKRGRPKKSNK